MAALSLSGLLIAFLLLTMASIALDHEKSILTLPYMSNIYCIKSYQGSLLYTSGNDIVQRDNFTGLVQRVFRAHTDEVYSFLIKDEQILVSSGWDDMLILWDMLSGSIIRRIEAGTDMSIRSIDVWADRVFVAGGNGQVKGISLSTGRVLYVQSLAEVANCVKYFEGQLYVGGSFDSGVVKLDAATGRFVLTFEGQNDVVYSLDVLQVLVTASGDKMLRIWNPTTGNPLGTIGGLQSPPYAVAIDSENIFAGLSDGDLISWALSTLSQRWAKEPAHNGGIISMELKDGKLFTGSLDSEMAVWDLGSGNLLVSQNGTNKKLRSIAVWKQLVLQAGEQNSIVVWSILEDEEPITTLIQHTAFVFALLIHADTLFSGSGDKSIKHWNLTSFEFLKTFLGHQSLVYTLDAASTSLYSGDSLGVIKTWDIETGIESNSLIGHDKIVSVLKVWNGDFFSGSYDTTVKRWNAKTYAMIYLNPFEYEVLSIVINMDKVYIASFGIFVFPIQEPSQISESIDKTPVYSIVLAGRGIFCGREDGVISLIFKDTLSPLSSFIGHTSAVMSLVLDDSGLLYSASFDGTVKKWDMASRRVAFSFEDRSLAVLCLGVWRGELLVGLRGGDIVTYSVQTATFLWKEKLHDGPVTAIALKDDLLLTSGSDGILSQKDLLSNDRTILHDYSSLPIRSFSLGNHSIVLLQGDTYIVQISTERSFSSTIIEIAVPAKSLFASNDMIFVGSISGIVMALSIDSGDMLFEFREHTAPVNSFVLFNGILFTASEDKTIVMWSLESKRAVNTLKRTSMSSLGHVGPVKDIAICNGVLFSVSSDLTTRRWNTVRGTIEDFYIGHFKTITTVKCFNGSVFTGSEDFSVLMYRPSLPNLSQPTKISTTTSLRSRGLGVKIIMRSSLGEEQSSLQAYIIAIGLAISFILVAIAAIFTINFSKLMRSAGNDEGTNMTVGPSFMLTGLETLINTSKGLSMHAALELKPDAFITLRMFAAGGGGSLYFVEAQDPTLVEQHGKILVQKIIFNKGRTTVEMFHQEVAIMVMLGDYPHFCKIVGYTAEPLSIIMKYYSKGSLNIWMLSNKLSKVKMVKILKEVSKALQVMHEHHLAHCDIKTQNVLVEMENNLPSCFLSDFGITQVMSEEALATKAFNVINARGLSSPYASPESFINARKRSYINVDFKMYDLYSLACLMFENSLSDDLFQVIRIKAVAMTNYSAEDEKIVLEPFTYLCQIKGKEVRTLLIKAFDQWLKVPAHELNVITEVVGMLHNASLLVDDVEDNSLLRRGIPVAHKIFGVPQTINCANYVYFLALEKITKLNNICLLKAFTEELLNLHIGQGMDISWRDSSTCPSETEYLKMIENKTGGLLRLAVKLMQCCSTSTEMRDKDLMKLVNCLGRFYQIRDDYLNVQSTDYMKNKSYCEDLTEGKFSFPIIHCINNSPDYGKQLLNILRRRPTDDEVKRFAVSLMEKSGSFVYTLSALEQAKKELVSEFEEIGPNEELNAILKSLFLLK